MKNLILLGLALPLAAGCKSSTEPLIEEGGGGGGGRGSIQVVGVLTGASSSLADAISGARFASIPHDPSPSCQTDGQPNSFFVTPASYRVMLKRLTLLGSAAGGTADHHLIPAIANIADGKEVNFVSDSVFVSSANLPPAGTYDGIAIEVFYIGQEIPMVIPTVNIARDADDFAAADYLTRGYFSPVGNIEPRQVTIFADAGSGTVAEYWVNSDHHSQDAFSLVAVTDSSPRNTLDLWHNPNFWCQDGLLVEGEGCTNGWREPLTICTRATGNCDPVAQNTDFTFGLAGNLVIPADASENFTITFNFNVANKFVFSGNMNYDDPETEAFGTYRVGYDCGYRILFPDVSITISSSGG